MNDPLDVLGVVTKTARIRAGMKRSELAEKLDITIRYLMYIENGQQKPSYPLLFQIVRILFIQTDEIFYPELEHDCQDINRIITLLHKCDRQNLKAVAAMLISLLEE